MPADGPAHVTADGPAHARADGPAHATADGPAHATADSPADGFFGEPERRQLRQEGHLRLSPCLAPGELAAMRDCFDAAWEAGDAASPAARCWILGFEPFRAVLRSRRLQAMLDTIFDGQAQLLDYYPNYQPAAVEGGTPPGGGEPSRGSGEPSQGSGEPSQGSGEPSSRGTGEPSSRGRGEPSREAGGGPAGSAAPPQAGAGRGRRDWHRDFTFVRSTDGLPLMITVLIFVDDVQADTGPTLVLPASHRVPTRVVPRHDGAPRPDELALPVRAGETIVLNSSIVHSRGFNTSASPRRGVVMNFGYWWMKPWDEDLPLPAGVHTDITPEMEQLLGLRCPGDNLYLVSAI